jgi:hypothetical protein
MSNQNKNKTKFRQEYYITNEESLQWFLILIEVDENDLPLKTYIIRMPEPDSRFTIYPNIKN